MLGDHAGDQSPIIDAAQQTGMRARRKVDADDMMAIACEKGCKIATEPAARSGEQDVHGHAD
jgi:hypothetical protein